MISRSAEIRLNPKLINTQERLRLTLCHEMCHVAAWLLDNRNDAHGPSFQKWREIAEARIPGITVETYHTYKVDFPVIYECMNPYCYGLWNRCRRSLKLENRLCGLCESPIVRRK